MRASTASLGLRASTPGSGGQNGFVLSFAVGLLLAIAPLTLVSARLAVVGEVDMFDTDATLIAERLHGPISELFPEYKLRMTNDIRPAPVVIARVWPRLFDRLRVPSAWTGWMYGGAAGLALIFVLLDTAPEPFIYFRF